MNDKNNIYNQNEVKNKLQNFQEGKDYFVTPSKKPEIKDYTFYNDRLKSLFGGNNWVPVRVWQEKYEDENVSYRGHFEEGKDYYYSAQRWDYGKDYQHKPGEWFPIEKQEIRINNNGDWRRTSIRGRELGNEPKAIGFNGENREVEKHKKYLAELEEKKHFYEMRLIEERDHPKSCCEKHTQNWINSPRRQELIESIKKSISEFESKIQFEKDWLTKNDNEYFQRDLQQKGRMGRGEKGSFITDKKDNNSDLEKENQELKQQLAAVQVELAKVLAELKKLTGKSEALGKLEQQQAQNERVMKKGSVAEIKEQAAKSQTLLQEAATMNTVAPVKNEPKNSMLPYAVGGSLLAVGLGGVAFWWKKHSRK